MYSVNLRITYVMLPDREGKLLTGPLTSVVYSLKVNSFLAQCLQGEMDCQFDH